MKFFNKVPDEFGDLLMREAENFYNTKTDPDQMPINEESGKKLAKIHPSWLTVGISDDDKVIGAAVIMPTQKELGEQFVAGNITEKELLEKTIPAKYYDAYYLCSILVLPEQRRKGNGTIISLAAIRRTAGDQLAGKYFFAWPYSDEGERLMEDIKKRLGIEIFVRSKR